VPVEEYVWNGVAPGHPRAPLRDPPTVAYAGRLDAKKGVEVLIRAMSLVAAQHPTARLLIAGHGPERAALERLARDLGVAGRVTFLGYLPRPEMEEALSGAWVQAVPSLWAEPFGLVAAEAMMRGTAVVVSGSGGLGEIVEHGVTGLRVRPGDAASLAAALGTLVADRAAAEAMGGAARAHALANLTIDRAVDRYLELYDRVRRRAGAGT
jgi:glycosyltransferase involved in cell wall biosynthesis